MRLTTLSPRGGCACKLPPGVVYEVARRFGEGTETFDDAGVLRIGDDLALVHTVDFFTPVVDDPGDFGRIAAANALSDIYAMGARPVCAVSLVAFPLEDLGQAVLAGILDGAKEIARQAGVAILGGHSIDDPVPKFGLAVSGLVHPAAVIANSGGLAGDALVLTKPVGAGVICTALKRGRADTRLVQAATAAMVSLNDRARDEAIAAKAHAMTDVSGFGLLGHLHELAAASGVAAVIDAGEVPALEGSLELLASGLVTGGGGRNRDFLDEVIEFDEDVPNAARALLCDPMTSGGLLVAVAEAQATRIRGPVIGRLVDGPPGTIRVRRCAPPADDHGAID
jgi:selenide, water dikinase